MPQETFYSESRGLMITITPPQRVIEDGMSKVIGGRTVQFTPMGQSKFGSLTTDDPEIIEALRKCPDVFDALEFNKRSVPAEKRLEETERKLFEANRLLEKLKAETSGKAAPAAATTAPPKAGKADF